MTPKEKAIKLYNNYMEMPYPTHSDRAKQCALIAVDLRLEGDFIFSSIEYGENSFEYWQNVKQEIENL
jgi:hypothetical protein